MAKSARKPTKKIPTNQAASPLSDVERRDVLNRVAFGDGWDQWVGQIEARIADVPDDAPLKQSTRRALVMIKEMMFEKF